MKAYQITAPQRLDVHIQLPSSKSISNRVLLINALGGSTVHPENLSECDDTQVMIKALNGEPKEVIDIQAAGTAMRFLTAYLSVMPGCHILTGTKRMQERPIRLLVDALRKLGAQIEYVENDGFPPLRIMGKELTEDHITLPGNVSSQYISALLMIAPCLKNGLTLTLTGNIISKPYIELTLKLMNDFGVQAIWTNEQELQVRPQSYQSRSFYVESDWSAASYWYQIAALASVATITLPGLFQNSYQGDSKVAELFRCLGVETTYGNQTITLSKTERRTHRLNYNFIDQPDLAQTFVVTCALLGVPFRFCGLQSLKIKETDRMTALIQEMKKIGYILREEEGSILSWDGEKCQPTGEAIDTYEDHRMAMAFAPACFILPDIRINHPQVVSKSYPHYWEDLQAAGFNLKEV